MSSVHGISVSGGSFPAEIWNLFVSRALDPTPVADFPLPKQLPAFRSWEGKFQSSGDYNADTGAADTDTGTGTGTGETDTQPQPSPGGNDPLPLPSTTAPPTTTAPPPTTEPPPPAAPPPTITGPPDGGEG
jgi:hypothetical protein